LPLKATGTAFAMLIALDSCALPMSCVQRAWQGKRMPIEQGQSKA